MLLSLRRCRHYFVQHASHTLLSTPPAILLDATLLDYARYAIIFSSLSRFSRHAVSVIRCAIMPYACSLPPPLRRRRRALR